MHRLPFALVLGLGATLPTAAWAQNYPPVEVDRQPAPAPQGNYPPADGGARGGGSARGGGGSGRIPDILRPGTKPWFFTGALGPSFYGIDRGTRSEGKLALDFGYHLDGAFEGPSLGGSFELTFGDFVGVNPAFRFMWDIVVHEPLGVTIAPFAKAGYFGIFDDGNSGHALNVGFGAEGRMVLDDVGLVLFRPIQLDNYVGDLFGDAFTLGYTLLFGGGVIW
ncbi:MAG: hypothetical protein AAGN82_24465 [Myxococcota bacterium]